jgi:hypothetical protein
MKKSDPKYLFWPLERTPEGREKIFETVAGKALLHIFFKIFSYQLAVFTFFAILIVFLTFLFFLVLMLTMLVSFAVTIVQCTFTCSSICTVLNYFCVSDT